MNGCSDANSNWHRSITGWSKAGRIWALELRVPDADQRRTPQTDPFAAENERRLIAVAAKIQSGAGLFQFSLTFTTTQLGADWLDQSLTGARRSAGASAQIQQLNPKVFGESRLFMLEQLAELEFQRQDFPQAQLLLEQATQLAPRNLIRQQKLLQLSRLNHDYERQYKAARDMVKFARHSMYEQPDLYLNLARACIDFAVSVDEDGETNKLSRQATDCLQSMRHHFPEAELDQQQLVLQARLLYLRDQKDKAKKNASGLA